MKKGALSPVMYLVLGIIVLLAVIIVIFSLRDKSFGILDIIKGGLP